MAGRRTIYLHKPKSGSNFRTLGRSSQVQTYGVGKTIVWSSCASSGGGGGGGGFGNGTRMQTAFGSSDRAKELAALGEGIFLMGTAQTLTGFLAIMGLPTMAVGVSFAAWASALKKVTFSRPCSPSNSNAVMSGFEEPDFNTFQQQYAAYLAGRVPTPPSIPPMENN